MLLMTSLRADELEQQRNEVATQLRQDAARARLELNGLSRRNHKVLARVDDSPVSAGSWYLGLKLHHLKVARRLIRLRSHGPTRFFLEMILAEQAFDVATELAREPTQTDHDNPAQQQEAQARAYGRASRVVFLYGGPRATRDMLRKGLQMYRPDLADSGSIVTNQQAGLPIWNGPNRFPENATIGDQIDWLAGAYPDDWRPVIDDRPRQVERALSMARDDSYDPQHRIPNMLLELVDGRLDSETDGAMYVLAAHLDRLFPNSRVRRRAKGVATLTPLEARRVGEILDALGQDSDAKYLVALNPRAAIEIKRLGGMRQPGGRAHLRNIQARFSISDLTSKRLIVAVEQAAEVDSLSLDAWNAL
jgi:hypothetical protein